MSDARNILRGINLNLLLVFDALLRRGTATSAAEELGVTTSAVSHSLRELRALFDDPLFVRTRQGMEPTALSKAVQPELGTALRTLGEVVGRKAVFDPAESTRRCAISCADDLAMTALPVFVRDVAREAPKMVIEILPRGAPPLEKIQTGAADLVVQLSAELPSWANGAELYTDELVCLVRRNHPTVRKSLTLAAYKKLPHIRIAPEGYGSSAVDAYLDSKGIERRVEFFVYSFAMAHEFVARTDAILTAPSRMASVAAKRLGLRIMKPPLNLPPFTSDVVWHRGRDDNALAWLRERLRAAAQSPEGNGG